MQRIQVRLDIGSPSAATDEGLRTSFAAIVAAGGSRICVERDLRREHVRADFSLERHDRPQLVNAFGRLLADLAEVRPETTGEWVVTSVILN